MGAAAITLSSTVVIGLLLLWRRKHWSNWWNAAFGIMFGNGIVGTALGGISLVTGKSIVELAGAASRSANKMAGGRPAVTIGPVLVLVVILGFAASQPKFPTAVAVLGIVVGTATVGTPIGMIATQANTAVVDTVDEGVKSLGQQVEGGSKGYSVSPPAPTGADAGMSVGGGVTR